MALRLLASELAAKAKEATKAEQVKPVPLWITGHSLGAALASLAYARYLRYPRDLGRGIVLRDAYTFGCQSRRLPIAPSFPLTILPRQVLAWEMALLLRGSRP